MKDEKTVGKKKENKENEWKIKKNKKKVRKKKEQ